MSDFYNYGGFAPNQHTHHAPPARPPYAVAQFLTGATNQMPPPTGANIAMGHFAPALNNGYFDPFGGQQVLGQAHGRGAGAPLDSTQNEPAEQAPRRPRHPTFDVLITQIAPGGQQLEIPLTLDRNITPDKFYETVRKNMKVAADVPLGWKTSDSSGKSTSRRLETEDDAKTAIETVLGMNDSPRRKNLISLRVVNCSPAPEKKAKESKEPKETELAFREEIAIIKQHTACQKCGESKYCWIRNDGGKVGEHVPLTWEAILLWARLMKNDPDKVPRDCSAPPNALGFDTAVKQKALRQERSSRPGSTTNVEVKPDIHIHLNDTPLGPAYTTHAQPDSKLGKRARNDAFDSDDDDDVMVSIAELLRYLDTKMPLANFAQYAEALEKAKITYCHQLLDMSDESLLDIGVGRGVVKDLLRGSRRLLQSAKKQRVDAEKENTVIEV